MDDARAATQEVAQGEAPRPDDLALRLSAIVGTLETMASHRETLRRSIEDRWLIDLEQYHGHYDAATLERLRAKKRSEIFANLTRPKTNTVEAKLFDMLFPTDDKNWDIQPSPVPELTDQSRELVEQMAEIKRQVQEQGEPATPAQDTALAQAKAQSALLQQKMAEARRKAKAMMAVMDDQLTECQYPAQARNVIEDGCRIGSGIMKGPIITGHERKRWYHADAGYEMRGRGQPTPVFRRVDPWGFYPDPDARTIEESEGTFERHLMNKKQLRRLAHQEGFDKDAIRRVLAADPKYSTPNPIVQLRAVIGSHTDTSMKRYHVWEYHGPMEWEDVRDLVMATRGDDAPEMLADFEAQAADKLNEIHVTAWFCQGQMLYFGPYPLDSNEPLYSVWNYEKDESSVFGFGVPYLMRDPQKAINGGWRMMLDNAGVAAGPQVVVDKTKVEPADGSDDYSLAPMKTWLKKASSMPGERPFETYDIAMHQPEMAQIIEIAMRFVDQETGVPQMAAGEQGEGVTKTLGGMALLMNSTNVLFRRAVKNWDDDMTTPSHRRLYDWNMQFHSREDIKGDYEVEARGTSVLLVREIESQNLMAIVMHFSAHPVIGPLMKVPQAFRRLVQTMMIPADELVMTDEELEEAAARAKEEPPPPDPAVLKAEVDMNIAQMETETRLQVAQMAHETAMMRLAEERNMSMEKLQAMLEQTRMKADSDERKMAVEAAMTARIGPSGGGHF